MIPRTSVLRQASTWQIELAGAITDPAELLKALELSPAILPVASLTNRAFPLRVPHSYVSRMRKGDPNDPLLRQVLPLAREDLPAPGFSDDPVGDLTAMVIPGLLHKYHGRVLLITTGACAIHCRYCFRRQFPYLEANPAVDQWHAALNYIDADNSITEVILSGGDPLVLSDRRLQELSACLEKIPHVQRLRIHTRLPIVLPARVNNELLRWFKRMRLQSIIVVHANHANEINQEVREACRSLAQAGVTLLNQSVLLRGVNNHGEALVELSEALFRAGVLPYYLHLLDKVQGAAHFEVNECEARHLLQYLNARLPGYLVPRLVKEEAGMPGKTLVF
ncbi:MAG TPA: EF-P beta-lysylation protein EpmB [Acidiferrobacterales bacterium]|nr:EF-P beta-lysylation protein EpmB [Acidiferrobacterales bacterium]